MANTRSVAILLAGELVLKNLPKLFTESDFFFCSAFLFTKKRKVKTYSFMKKEKVKYINKIKSLILS